MKHNIQVKNSIQASNQQILLAIKKSSDIINYYSVGIQPSKTILWTPEPQKSIYLTSVQVSAPLAVSILLSDDDIDFLSLKITQPFSTVSQAFPSPFKLTTGNSLMLSTSDEDISCNINGAATATQVAYNGRSDFTNVNNAIGLSNGTLASLSSALLTQARGRLVLGYSILPTQYQYFEIEQVTIKYYCRLSLTLAVGVSSMILYWRPNTQVDWTQLQEISLSIIGSVNYLTNPIQYDITDTVLGAPDPWAVINNLQTSFVGTHTGLGIGNIVQLDAIEIQICMSGKNQITVFGYEA
ncbi:hypothetical protein EDD76_11645 [Kineothrix alysoides]|uniref:Uncharacterized protein n=1 Tax=Kineothrix alysoides TaxID=1469948 RepID=A0A4R1QS24_9FIRM|nr:hypothetical protein [Kineothrix alysoides]TCL55205.1 hypothetical protein EDD76_11645 [Kineothrix alysoides]